VVGTAVALGVPVVVTEEDPASNGPTAASILRHLDPAVPVLGKEVFGAADNPAILTAINITGRSTVVVVGMETDVCVAHSALGFRDRGFRSVIVHDAVFSAAAAHAHGLARLQREGCDMVSAKELYYDWVRNLTSARAFEANNADLAVPPGFSL
jgi:isochorismate hydrolase